LKKFSYQEGEVRGRGGGGGGWGEGAGRAPPILKTKAVKTSAGHRGRSDSRKLGDLSVAHLACHQGEERCFVSSRTEKY
jgi:hypothetical protein